MHIKLTVVAGPHQGRLFTFDEHAVFLVGRSPDAHFSLHAKDPYVSRHHFLVEINPPLCRLRDIGSHNGTLVNSEKVGQADLKDGDLIKIGETEIRVQLEGIAPVELETTRTLGALLHSLETRPLESTEAAMMGRSSFTAQEHRTPTDIPATTGPIIPGYEIKRELGHGGMGIVYLALQSDTGEEVAIKTILPAIHPTEHDIQKFLREADIHKKLDHPQIVAFRDRGSVDGMIWFAMEYVPGTDAQKYLAAHGPLSVSQAVRWGLSLLDAIQYAHSKGIVHRDVKPSNLLVTTIEGQEVVKLADFGLARAYEASQMSGLTLTGTAGGTPKYMPPEQVLDMKTVLPTADQYSAAATIYNLLTRQALYPPPPSLEQIFRQILQDDPVPIQSRRPDLPTGLCAAIHKALSRKPQDRFKDVGAFTTAIRGFAGG